MKNIDLILLNLIYYLIKLKEIQVLKTIKKCVIVTQIGMDIAFVDHLLLSLNFFRKLLCNFEL